MKDIYTLSDLRTKKKRLEIISSFPLAFGSLAIQYKARYQNTKILRDIIDAFCTHYSVPAKWKTRLVLIFDELNNNAIEHGSTQKDSNHVFISIKQSSKGWEIEGRVSDCGGGTDAKTCQELTEAQAFYKDNVDFTKHHSIRGRGLFLIIAQLVQVLRFEPSLLGGVSVYFKKTISLKDSE